MFRDVQGHSCAWHAGVDAGCGDSVLQACPIACGSPVCFSVGATAAGAAAADRRFRVLDRIHKLRPTPEHRTTCLAEPMTGGALYSYGP